MVARVISLTASRRRGVLAAACVGAAGIVLLAGLQWASGDGEVPSEAAGSGDVRLAGPVAPGRDPLTAPGSVLVGVGPAAPRAQSASERPSSPRSSAPTPTAAPGLSSASPGAPTSATSPAAQVARNPFRAPGQAATTQATQTPSTGAPAADAPAADAPAAGTPSAAAAPPGGRNPFQALVTPPAAPSGGQQPSGQQPGGQPADGPQSGEPGAPTGSPTTAGPATDRDGVLGRGNSGPQVRDLQQVLVDRGWTLRVDGIFGPKTERVVRELQRRRGLVPDGLVGPKTRAVLSSR